jgi:hypothetical protein
MDFGIDSVILESGIHRTPIFAAHRAKRTNTVPGNTYMLAGYSAQRFRSIRQNQSPITVDESQPEHPAKLINLSRLIGRDARCSLLVCAVRERFRLVLYRSFDVDCFIGIHGILLPPLDKAIRTPNPERASDCGQMNENCLKHRQIAISCNFLICAFGESEGFPACI